MGIDVLDHIWVGVFSASFVQQLAEEQRRTGDASSGCEKAMQFADEAKAVADMALAAYRDSNAREAGERMAQKHRASLEGLGH